MYESSVLTEQCCQSKLFTTGHGTKKACTSNFRMNFLRCYLTSTSDVTDFFNDRWKMLKKSYLSLSYCTVLVRIKMLLELQHFKSSLFEFGLNLTHVHKRQLMHFTIVQVMLKWCTNVIVRCFYNSTITEISKEKTALLDLNPRSSESCLLARALPRFRYHANVTARW